MLTPRYSAKLTLQGDSSGDLTLGSLDGQLVIQLAPFYRGPSGGSTLLGVAGEAIGGNRLAYLDSSGLARYASANNILHANKVWAMSTQAASAGNSFNAVRTGEVEEGSWNWTLNMPVFLGNNGVPTQTLPGDAMFSLVIGFPVSSTKLFVNIREPIILN